MSKQDIAPCIWNHEDCFGHAGVSEEVCTILSCTDFPEKNDCPFYKKRIDYIRQTVADDLKMGAYETKRYRRSKADDHPLLR